MHQPITTTAGLSLDSLEDLLMEVAAELQLAPSLYAESKERYLAVASWLAREDRRLAPFEPSIFAQGSAKIGTLARPLRRKEHDVDLVLHLPRATLDNFVNPTHLLDVVVSELSESPHHADLVERKKRCVRLQYADRFHLDVLPTLPDPSTGPTAVFVPDRELRDWVYGDPKGYAGWFAGRSRHSVARGDAEIEQLPEHEQCWDKSPLQVIVQLIKRWRDKRFSDNPEMAPVSILLTTLAAIHYNCACSVQLGLSIVLEKLCELVDANKTPFDVPNPVNPKEDFSECWKRRPAAYEAFKSEIKWFRAAWLEVLQLRGPKLAEALSALFGDEVVAGAYRRQADHLSQARAAGTLGVTALGTLIASKAVARAVVAPNTFYGDS